MTGCVGILVAFTPASVVALVLPHQMASRMRGGANAGPCKKDELWPRGTPSKQVVALAPPNSRIFSACCRNVGYKRVSPTHRVKERLVSRGWGWCYLRCAFYATTHGKERVGDVGFQEKGTLRDGRHVGQMMMTQGIGSIIILVMMDAGFLSALPVVLCSVSWLCARKPRSVMWCIGNCEKVAENFLPRILVSSHDFETDNARKIP